MLDLIGSEVGLVTVLFLFSFAVCYLMGIAIVRLARRDDNTRK